MKLEESTVYLNISVEIESGQSEKKRGKIVVNEEKRKPEWWRKRRRELMFWRFESVEVLLA